MPSAVPARMYVRAFYYNGQAQRRLRVVSLPLFARSSSRRYSLDDPRIPPPAPSKPAPQAAAIVEPSREDRAERFTWNARKAIR